MIKLNQLNLEHNNLKNILQNKYLADCTISGMTQEFRDVLQKLAYTPHDQLRRINIGQSGSPIQKNQYLFRRLLPQINQKNIQTIKYIGEYKSTLGVLTSRQEMKQKKNRSLSVPKNQNNIDNNYYQQNYIINRYISPNKLGNRRRL